LDYAGRTLVGKYRVEKLLGQGGMGSVWKGTHVITGRKIAIKILDEKFLSNANVVQRFGREARAASSIAHEGIVEVLDLDQTEEGIPFLVMEFLEGESLAHRIDHGDPMNEEQVVRIGALLLDALHAAHESGVVHRDLKPDNIYVVPGRRGEAIKILDFGISYKDDERDAKLTVTGSVLGTPHYMSPEQAMGDSDTDRRVDIYAAGVVLYECVVGAVPFDGANYNKLLRVILDSQPVPPRQRGAKISAAVEAVILKALSKKKEDRPSTAAEMRDMLVRAARGEPVVPGVIGTRASAHGAATDDIAARWLDAPLENEPRSRPEVAVAAARADSPPRAQLKPPAARGDITALDPLAEGPSSHSLEIDERALERRPSGSRSGQTWLAATGGASSVGPSATSAEVTRAAARDDAPAGRSRGSSPIPTSSTTAPVAPMPDGTAGGAGSSRWVLVMVIALASITALAFGLRAFLGRPSDPPEPPMATAPDAAVERTAPSKQPPGVSFVEITIDVTPAGADARMRLDGIPGATSPIRVRRGTRHVLEVSAPGYLDERVEIRAEQNQRIRVELRSSR
jgi:serine/threonine-protein kinase